MIKHLKDRQYYIDLYDHNTVEHCRNLERLHQEVVTKKLPPFQNKEFSDEALQPIVDAFSELRLYFEKGEEYLKKDKTIEEWIRRDTALDNLLERTVPPENIRCLKCLSLCTASSKDIYSEDSRDRVLFMFDCPRGCLPHRAFFQDGQEWKPKVQLCTECQSVMESKNTRTENTITTVSTCIKCGHVEEDSFDLSPKEEKVDELFEVDRQRFCLSEKEGMEYAQSKIQSERMGRLSDEWKEKEKHKADYDAMALIKRLTILELEDLLVPLCEKQGYTRLTFGTPEMGKDLFVPFTIYDGNPKRTSLASTHDLQKLIKKGLKDTNWRLMSDGCSYRMGIVTGRLRAYEREEDLLKLVRKQDSLSK